ncbi:MAG: ribonuclease HI family protein [Chloroflexi bacterium]|nr:ribonuclease HI family protein [Chloroflexota bacterium]
MKLLIVQTDGASHGNPGPAAIGAVIRDDRRNVLARISEPIGIATNNEAEYRAIIAALQKALTLGATNVFLLTDSELVVRQVAGEYAIRRESLKPLYLKVKQLESQFQGCAITHIPGEENNEAHGLASRALKPPRAP